MLNTEKLVKLIQENPDADLMPMVDSEMGNPDYAFTEGHIKNMYVDEVRYGDLVGLDLGIKPIDNNYFDVDRIFFKSKDLNFLKGQIEEYVDDNYAESSDEFVERKVDRLVNKINWDKVIVLEISDC